MRLLALRYRAGNSFKGSRGWERRENMVLNGLEPRRVFEIFEEICNIPHGSGNMEGISEYCIRFARERELEVLRDAANNIVIRKNGSTGMEQLPPLIVQSHLDMVCAKEAFSDRDMSTEGLELFVQGDVIGAHRTSLGADDGIGVALSLALLDHSKLKHPPLEIVLTADEETGMIGAQALDTSCLKGKRMISLDSEREGTFTIACAGGMRVECSIPVSRKNFDGMTLDVTLDGLKGGHSGEEINSGRGNANKLLARVLCSVAQKTDTRLCAFNGGEKENAIPRMAAATILVKSPSAAKDAIREQYEQMKKEYRSTDDGIRIRTVEAGAGGKPLDEESTKRALALLFSAINGVQMMSTEIAGMVQLSLNMGVAATENETISTCYTVRGASESQIAAAADQLAALTEALGGQTKRSGTYPPWEYVADTPLQKVMEQVFLRQYGKKPVILAIHGGIECGLLSRKIPGLDCVCIGPDEDGIHTPSERLHITSTKRVWDYLCSVVEECCDE